MGYAPPLGRADTGRTSAHVSLDHPRIGMAEIPRERNQCHAGLHGQARIGVAWRISKYSVVLRPWTTSAKNAAPSSLRTTSRGRPAFVRQIDSRRLPSSKSLTFARHIMRSRQAVGELRIAPVCAKTTWRRNRGTALRAVAFGKPGRSIICLGSLTGRNPLPRLSCSVKRDGRARFDRRATRPHRLEA